MTIAFREGYNKFGGATKGQMKSERIYEIFDFPKYQCKNLIGFCPKSLFRQGITMESVSTGQHKITHNRYSAAW